MPFGGGPSGLLRVPVGEVPPRTARADRDWPCSTNGTSGPLPGSGIDAVHGVGSVHGLGAGERQELRGACEHGPVAFDSEHHVVDRS